MKEDKLREMIRTQIKSSLKEAPMARAAVGTKLGTVEKMAGIKMLKKALGQGGPAQQAAGLLQVVKAISGNNPTTAKLLARMIMKGGLGSEEETPVEEATNPGLAGRQARVDKTQAMVMLKKMLGSRPATQQVDFTIDLVNSLGLKDSAKKRLLLMMRKGLK